MSQQPSDKVPTHIAYTFFRAVGCQPIHSIVKRRGKIYDMCADKRSGHKIISMAKLEQMTLYDLVCWLQRYHLARILFPDPTVYKEHKEHKDN